MSLSPGRAIPRDMREWDRWAASQVAIPPQDVKVFTPVWTGFSVDPTGDLYFANLGTQALIWAASNITTGTSNATTFTISNLPSSIQPVTQRESTMFAFDNGGFCQATARMTGSTITFCLNTVVGSIVRPLSSGWTNPGTKGLSSVSWWLYPLV